MTYFKTDSDDDNPFLKKRDAVLNLDDFCSQSPMSVGLFIKWLKSVAAELEHLSEKAPYEYEDMQTLEDWINEIRYR